MKLVTGFAMAASISSICGCASLSTCRYRSTATIQFPVGAGGPLAPSLEETIKLALEPLGFSGGAQNALPNGDPLVRYWVGGWPQMFGERVDVSLEPKTAQVTIFDFNNSTGNPASKFDRQIMDALENGIKEAYGASVHFKPGDERFCLGP
jgi:hypothetical protein